MEKKQVWTGVAAASKTFIALATKPTIQLTELFQDLKVTRKSNGWMFLTEMFFDFWFFLHFMGFSMLISIIGKLSFTPIQPLKDCKSPKIMQKKRSLYYLYLLVYLWLKAHSCRRIYENAFRPPELDPCIFNISANSTLFVIFSALPVSV